MSNTSRDRLVDAILEIREQDALDAVDELLTGGAEPAAIVEMCREAVAIVGERFERDEAFIPELVMTGLIVKRVSEVVKPLLKHDGTHQRLGCVILGTVKGDIHDIGKDIVASVLDAGGFEVIDLGVDVPAERFVEALRARASCVLGMSCLLTTGFDSMKATVDAIQAAGLRERAKIMIGGAPIIEQVCEYAGADGWGTNPANALDLAKRWADGGAG
jgi:5-methyltetrahydrofolate--homocysteine methyltransferase